MEKMGDWEQKIVNELINGMKLTKQLQLQLQLNAPSSSRESPQSLVHKIYSSYEKIFSMMSLSSFVYQPAGVTGITSDSPPPSLTGSPKSDQDSDKDLKDLQDAKDASRKRKGSERWTKRERVNPGMGLEGLDDGFSWRKYGQKDILGAKHPRGYYRCTHRMVQGCLATKQVQRSDEDPTIFEITYCGRHTCSQTLHQNDPNPLHENNDHNPSIEPQQQEHMHHSQDLLSNFRSDLKVIIEGLELDHQEQPIPPFHFHSSASNVQPDQNQVFSPSNNFMGNFSPSFVSPSASTTTNYFSPSSSGLHHSFDSELSDIVGAAAATSTSASNSPSVNVNQVPFGSVECDPRYFSFDNHGFRF